MGFEKAIEFADELLKLIEEDNGEFKKLREEYEEMNITYHKFRAEIKSEDGASYSITVDTVDMIEAYRMVEDTGLDGCEIFSITRL